MKRCLIALLIFFSNIPCFSQNNERVKSLVDEGIQLHDKGDYEAAIKKYDEALTIDRYYLRANYEKSYTCMVAKKYSECIETSKFILANFHDDPLLKQVYEVYGSALDDAGNDEEAIKVFDEGLEKFPDYYLLHFNKGLTLMRTKKYNEALDCYASALKNKGTHASSNYYIGVILQDNNRIPSLLAFLTFIAVEPQSDRSKKAYDAIQEIIYRDIKKDGTNTTVNIPMHLLDSTKKKSQNDFSNVELGFSLLGTIDNSSLDSLTKTAADKFDFKLQLLINALNNGKKEGTGFYWEHYVPFFIEMKQKEYTTVLSNIVLLSSGDKASLDWIKANNDRIKAFYDWLDKYIWN